MQLCLWLSPACSHSLAQRTRCRNRQPTQPPPPSPRATAAGHALPASRRQPGAAQRPTCSMLRMLCLVSSNLKPAPLPQQRCRRSPLCLAPRCSPHLACSSAPSEAGGPSMRATNAGGSTSSTTALRAERGGGGGLIVHVCGMCVVGVGVCAMQVVHACGAPGLPHRSHPTRQAQPLPLKPAPPARANGASRRRLGRPPSTPHAAPQHQHQPALPAHLHMNSAS